jgi:hypothetical protein
MTDNFVDSIGASPAPQLRSAVIHPALQRVPIKHILIGLPPAIAHTIHRLHQLSYADADLWSTVLVLPDRQITIAPDPGEGLAMLVRHLNLE